jgi:hypothetical protein
MRRKIWTANLLVICGLIAAWVGGGPPWGP